MGGDGGGVRVAIFSNVGLAAAKELTRYAINGVYLLNGNEGVWAAATDGRMLACVPCEVADDVSLERSVIVPSRAATKGRHTGRGVPNEMEIFDDGVEFWVSIGPVTFARKPDERFVGSFIDGQFPPIDEAIHVEQERAWVGINTELLRRLCKAINTLGMGQPNAVSLGIALDKEGRVDASRAFAVLGGGDGFGMLMPTTGSANCQKKFQDLVHRFAGKAKKPRAPKKAAKKSAQPA